ncbi:hypothetical protein SELMODRAFT_427075 [Selaginella moellendorffii]|uniref:riboflavin kinase n=1 Tax=Selaginella moellendorffii TaxID=88036 RepID=D8SYF6_SELML|nr:hypothetical protein SELMODRAFT_427075 [Selaginella moellendorffii]
MDEALLGERGIQARASRSLMDSKRPRIFTVLGVLPRCCFYHRDRGSWSQDHRCEGVSGAIANTIASERRWRPDLRGGQRRRAARSSEGMRLRGADLALNLRFSHRLFIVSGGEHYTFMKEPSHREIQATLVEIGDKDPSFVGSKEWIGAIELSFVLGVTSKILSVRSGADLPEKSRELAAHFDTQGTSVEVKHRGWSPGIYITWRGLQRTYWREHFSYSGSSLYERRGPQEHPEWRLVWLEEGREQLVHLWTRAQRLWSRLQSPRNSHCESPDWSILQATSRAKKTVGEELRLVVVSYIRPEANFSLLEDLINKIHEDGHIAKAALDMPPYSAFQEDKFLQYFDPIWRAVLNDWKQPCVWIGVACDSSSSSKTFTLSQAREASH